MLVAERYEKIVALVNKKGSIRVSELSELCQVTEETIRRDLDKLEKAGQLRRSHGGAVSLKEQAAETPYFEREIMHVEEKKKIAQKAVEFVSEGDRLILDASSSAWYVASVLPDIRLTVLTNSIKVALALAGKEKIELVSTGGILSPRSLSFVGPMAETALEKYHVNKAFISCKGVTVERGISESNEWQARIKQKMINMSDHIYLLADYSKLGITDFAHAAELNQLDTIITDQKSDPAYVQKLREQSQLQLIVV